MTSRMVRRAAAAASLVLAASLSACGGSDGGSGSAAPDDASLDDFCSSFNDLFDSVMSAATPGGDASGTIAALKKWAGDMEDVGTPSDMPDDARHGFELFVDQAKKLDDDASLQDLENLGEDLGSDDQADGQAFSAWATKNCPLDLPSIDPSDLPSVDPSDLPSVDPSDLESLESQLSELTQSP